MPNTADKVVIGTSATGGVVATTSAIISGLGFTGSGIAAGSTAAGIQAGIGNVVATSAFATLQSWGATGLIATTGVVGVGVVAGGLGYWGVK